MWNKQYYRKPLKIICNTLRGAIATPLVLVGVTLLQIGMIIMGETWGE